MKTPGKKSNEKLGGDKRERREEGGSFLAGEGRKGKERCVLREAARQTNSS